MARTLCEWKKSEIKEFQKQLEALIVDPQFICRKCARCSNTAKVLCKPVKAFRAKIVPMEKIVELKRFY